MSLPKLKGINGNVLVEPHKKEEKKVGGIIIPDVTSRASRGRLDKGTVIIGATFKSDFGKVEIKEGETVYYAPGAGNGVMFGTKEYLIIPSLQLRLVEETSHEQEPAAV